MHASMSSPCHCAAVRVAARKISAAYDRGFEPLGINVAQYALLRRIGQRQASLTTLGQDQGLDRSTVGRNVKVLERMGLVAAGRSDEDQREVMISLTAKGQDLLARAIPLWQASQRTLEAKLGADRIAVLREILEAL